MANSECQNKILGKLPPKYKPKVGDQLLFSAPNGLMSFAKIKKVDNKVVSCEVDGLGFNPSEPLQSKQLLHVKRTKFRIFDILHQIIT